MLIVKFLIDNGAVVNLANANGFSAYELANQSIEIVQNQAAASQTVKGRRAKN